RTRRRELSALHRPGGEFPIEITIPPPMKLGKGHFFGAFLRDISGRIERDAQLSASRARLDQELANAGSMQRLILPASLPQHPLVRFAAYYRTSRHAGGDYYDVLPLGRDRFAIMVADVSGHGAPAAIVMAMIRAVLHTYPGVPDDPPSVLNHVNRQFQYLWETPMFATATFGVLDAAGRTLRLASAGHPLPLLCRTGRVAALAVEPSLALLFGDLGQVPCTERELRPGDRLLFYTDGVTERSAADGTMFETERLTDALAGLGALDPEAAVERLIA